MMTKLRWATCLTMMLFAINGRILGAKELVPFRVSKVVFQSGGKRIQADFYQASTSTPHPSVIVLHGAGGTLFDGPEMRRMSADLAAAGNDVYFVHYFNRTGTWFGRDAGMQRNFKPWLETVNDAIRWVRGRQTSPAPIGLFGYSLGGFLVLAAGSNNPSVGAIVEQAGGMWNGNAHLIGTMPPTLLVHGQKDKRVPFDKYARPLVDVLAKRGTHFQKHFFLEEGHVFTQPAASEVRTDAVRFFAQHLSARRER
jgi:dienelactone hydrolase